MAHPGTDHPLRAARLEELRGLKERLARRTGEAAPPRTLELLRMAGDLLRRNAALAVDAAQIDDALRALGASAVRAGLGMLSVPRLRAGLLRAADEAMEAALAEGVDEVALWSASALEELRERDLAESALAATRRWVELGGETGAEAGALLAALSSELKELDRALRGKARWLVGLNERRRVERDLLDPGLREAAWWYSGRSECDDLVALLAGQPARRTQHAESCADCQRDMERSRVAAAPPPSRHLSSDDAWRYDLGTMPPAEQEAARKHAAGCPECAQVLSALDLGERAIAEMTAEAASPPPPATEGFSSTRRPGRHLVAAQSEFRLVLVRDPGRVRLIVRPMMTRGIAAAALSILPHRSTIKPRQSPEGLDFELGDPARVMGKVARVTVTVREGSAPFERDVEL